MATKIGIREVAKAAGVSVTTVSHALNDATSSRVNPQTQQHVRAVAKDLGYAPNRLASGLRNQRSQILGLVSDEITTTPFAGAMIRGAQDAAYERGYVLMVVNSGRDLELENREIRTLQQHQVDGIVYARMYHQGVSLPEELGTLPTVLLDAVTADRSISSVVPDEVAAAETAVEALVKAGHTRIGMLGNGDDIPATHGRLQGFRNALARHGLRFHPELVTTGVADTHGRAGGSTGAAAAPGAANWIVLFQRPGGHGRLPGRCRAGAPHSRGRLHRRNGQPRADRRGAVARTHHRGASAL